MRVKEEAGGSAFFCTDPTASVQQILEAFADRGTLAQNFHDQGDSNPMRFSLRKRENG